MPAGAGTYGGSMRQLKRRAGAGLLAITGAGMLLSLAGCGNFFVCENKPACPASGTGTGGTTTVSYVYGSNSASGPGYIDGYTLAKGTLTATTSGPYAVPYTPQTMAVSTNNGFLYV